MTEFNRELCDKNHNEVDRRITTVEAELKASAGRQEVLLALIHERFNKVTLDMEKRLPGWATVLIGCLTASTTGLVVAALK